MKLIEEKYLPYHLTENPCVIFSMTIDGAGTFKIEQKIPGHIKRVSGVFVSVTARNNTSKMIGIISLAFNGDGLRAKQFVVPKTTELIDTWHPVPLKEDIMPNSLLQGYYLDTSASSVYPYSLKIYLHYNNAEK
jgi:hypothetical protein